VAPEANAKQETWLIHLRGDCLGRGDSPEIEVRSELAQVDKLPQSPGSP
jgi:hypothetical protein